MINKVIKNMENYFGEFFREYLEIYNNRLLATLKNKYGEILLVSDEFIQEQLQEICSSFFYLSVRTLMYELYKNRDDGILIGKTGHDRYLSYVEMLKSPEYRDYLKKQYPVLHRILMRQMEYRIALLQECLDNYIDDIELIKSELNIIDYRIIKLNISSGDSHNNGKKVIILNTPTDKLLYKPHDLSAEKLFNSVVNLINEDDRIMYKLSVVKSVSVNNHSWHEYIEKKESRTDENVVKYYYKIGVYLGVLNLLSCEDIHRENIIARDDTPIIIDMETLTNCKVQLYNENATLIEQIMDENMRSVLGTMLLPLNSTFGVFDYDIGGISGTENIATNKWKGFDFQDAGTDSMRFVKVSKFASNKSDNILMFNGKDTLAREYNAEIIRGFCDAYEVIRSRQELIINLLKKSEANVRQVVRATAIYAKFLEAATYPEYLMDETKYKMLFEKMRIEGNNAEELKNEHEIKALQNGDVPYFYCNVNKGSLFSMYGEVDNYYKYNIIDIIKHNIERMSENDKKKQVYYINLALSTQKSNDEKCDVYHLPNVYKLVDETDFIKKRSDSNVGVYIATEIGDTLADRLVWNGMKNKCFMLANIVEGENRKYSVMDGSLYYYGGVIIFYLALYKTTGSEKYLSIAKGLISAGDELKLGASLNGIGLFSGIGSALYINMECFKYLNDTQYLDNAYKCLERIDDLCDQEQEYDLATGIAGTLILVSQMYEQEKEDKILKVASRLAQRLVFILEEINYDMNTGLAHGYAGVAWALYKYGNLVDEQLYIDAAIKCVELENNYFDQKLNNWKDRRSEDSNGYYWCYGAFGIGISRLTMLNINSNEIIERDVKRCKDIFIACDEDDLPDNHSLCHGLLGNYSVMNLYNNYYNDAVLADKMKQLQNKIIADFGKNQILFGDKEIIEDYSFMLGLSGMGYELLRWNNAEISSILGVEL